MTPRCDNTKHADVVKCADDTPHGRRVCCGAAWRRHGYEAIRRVDKSDTPRCGVLWVASRRCDNTKHADVVKCADGTPRDGVFVVAAPRI